MRKVFRSFQFKLIISLFLIVFVILGSLYFVINQTTQNAFREYVVQGGRSEQFREYVAQKGINLQFREYVIRAGGNQMRGLRASLIEYYENNETWEGVGSLLKRSSSQEEVEDSGNGSNGSTSGNGMQDVVLVGTDGKIIASSYDDDLVGKEVSGDMVEQAIELESNGERIGTLVTEDLLSVKLDETARQLLASVNRKMIYAGAVGLVVALLLGWLLFRQITEPLNKLTRATKKISSGDLDHKVSIESEDELGKLSESFNQMAQNLKESEEIRRRMIGDIAHELRTPLTVLSGEVEAIRDGVYKPTDDKLREIQEDLNLLNRLVEDLRELTLAEADELNLHRRPANPGHLIQRVVNNLKKVANHKKINFEMELPKSLPEIYLDTDRISQVLNNLLKNSLRHTEEGGRVLVRAKERKDDVIIEVNDNGEGIPEDKIDHVFDRFYRGDSSRSSEGGSGLGLSIAKELIQSHGGEIWIDSEPGEGTTVSFSLPK